MYRNQFQKIYFSHSLLSCTLPDVIYVEPRLVFLFLQKKHVPESVNAWNKIRFEISVSACSYSSLLPLLEKGILSCLVHSSVSHWFCSLDLHTPVLSVGLWVASGGILLEQAEIFLGYNGVPIEKE